MAREISSTTPQNQTSQSKESGVPDTQKGRHGIRDTSHAEAQIYHDKSVQNTEAKSLERRQISPQNQNMIIQLAKKGELSGFSSALQQHCSNLKELDQTISLLKNEGIWKSEDVQKIIINHFKILFPQEALPKLIEGLV